MPGVGFEPTCPHGQRILSPLRADSVTWPNAQKGTLTWGLERAFGRAIRHRFAASRGLAADCRGSDVARVFALRPPMSSVKPHAQLGWSNRNAEVEPTGLFDHVVRCRAGHRECERGHRPEAKWPLPNICCKLYDVACRCGTPRRRVSQVTSPTAGSGRCGELAFGPLDQQVQPLGQLLDGHQRPCVSKVDSCVRCQSGPVEYFPAGSQPDPLIMGVQQVHERGSSRICRCEQASLGCGDYLWGGAAVHVAHPGAGHGVSAAGFALPVRGGATSGHARKVTWVPVWSMGYRASMG